MFDQIALWFVRLFPLYDGSWVTGIDDYSVYTAWTAQFIDYGYVGPLFLLIVTIEAALAVVQLIMRIWEYVPGN